MDTPDYEGPEQPIIPNTPEEMFPGEFDVYTTKDAARELLRLRHGIDAAELIIGEIEPLPTVKVERSSRQSRLRSAFAIKYTQLKTNAARRRHS